METVLKKETCNEQSIPLKDRKDLYVIRTLVRFGWDEFGEDCDYFYWMSSQQGHLTGRLYLENNSAHIFEEKDKPIAEQIAALLNNQKDADGYYEVVSFYDAWRCL